MSIDMLSILYQANWGDEYVRLKSKLDALQKSQRYPRLAQEDPYSGYDNVYWRWLIVSVYPNGRQLLGEQLSSLTIKELQQLEQQLDSSLKHIRSRKVNKLGLNLLFGAQLVWLFTNVLVNYYIIALFFLVQNQLMFDSISALQKKVSYTLDSLVPGILRVLHESLVKIIVTSTPPAFGEWEQTLTSVTSWHNCTHISLWLVYFQCSLTFAICFHHSSCNCHRNIL